jgi:hypothetical protein
MWKSRNFPNLFSIGGTLQLFGRFRSQQKDLRQGKGRVLLFRWAKENGGLRPLQGFPLILTTSFCTILNTLHSTYECSVGEAQVLKAISHFTPFTLDNALMLHFQPGKSSTGYNVSSKYHEWDPSELSMYHNDNVRYEASYEGEVLVSTTSLLVNYLKLLV